MKNSKVKVKVNNRALLARINRFLIRQDQKLIKCRSKRCRQDFGNYYVIDVKLNAINEKNIELDKLGSRLGILKPYEELE
jgi:hypothetical protein